MASEEQREKDRAAYRQAAVREAIGLVGMLISLIAVQATVDPTFREVWIARFKAAFGTAPRRDREKEMLRQVQREISWMEHGMPESFRPEWGGIYGG
jgi:hypothetical protein